MQQGPDPLLTSALLLLLPLLLLAGPAPSAAEEAEFAREARLDLVLRFARAQAAFASGQAADSLAVLDANRGYLQVRLERVRALARLHGALGDLERAAGHLHGFSEGQEAKKP